jgi:hypothetical protein
MDSMMMVDKKLEMDVIESKIKDEFQVGGGERGGGAEGGGAAGWAHGTGARGWLREGRAGPARAC